MLADNDRLLGTVEQVLQASRARENQRLMNLAQVDLGELVVETMRTILGQRHLDESAIRFAGPSDPLKVLGDRAELTTAIVTCLITLSNTRAASQRSRSRYGHPARAKPSCTSAITASVSPGAI